MRGRRADGPAARTAAGVQQAPFVMCRLAATLTATLESSRPTTAAGRLVLATLAVLALVPAVAGARVVAVANGTSAVPLVDVRTAAVVATVPVGGNVRAVTASADGARAYV